VSPAAFSLCLFHGCVTRRETQTDRTNVFSFFFWDWQRFERQERTHKQKKKRELLTLFKRMSSAAPTELEGQPYSMPAEAIEHARCAIAARFPLHDFIDAIISVSLPPFGIFFIMTRQASNVRGAPGDGGGRTMIPHDAAADHESRSPPHAALTGERHCFFPYWLDASWPSLSLDSGASAPDAAQTDELSVVAWLTAATEAAAAVGATASYMAAIDSGGGATFRRLTQLA
jgi:hypothetical protein